MMRRTMSSKEENSSVSTLDNDDEKAGKLRKRDESRVSRAMLYLGLLSFVFIVAIVKLHHTRRHGVNIRRRRQYDAQKAHDNNLLPFNSIYRLSVEDKDGLFVTLSPYSGMVSLVVNVASE